MTAAVSIYTSTIGKKAIMALTGLILFGFVIGHLLGNLQIFLPDGREAINRYARFLHGSPGLLWTSRIVLLGAVLLHILMAIQLTRRNQEARPVAYRARGYREATYASRTMMWSGPILAFFVIYHLLHFTTGTMHHAFIPLDVHHNVVEGFRVWYVSAAYAVAMLALGLHLYHGGWSMFQSVGVNHPTTTPWLKRGAAFFALFVTAGNLSIPAAVLMGWVR